MATRLPVPAATPTVVRVVPDVAAVRRQFDYAAPASLAAQVRVGTMVRVELHGRRVAGWVVAVGVEPPDGVVLRPVLAVRGWGPPESLVDLTSWAAWRWAGARSALLATASPRTMVRTLRPASVAAVRQATPDGDGPLHADARLALEAAGLGGDQTRPVLLRLPPAAAPHGVVVPVAKRMLAAALAEPGSAGGRGVLVLVPGQAQLGPVSAALGRAGLPVAPLPDDWAAARSGGCVAVGTRAAAFAPVPELAGVIVVDAHDEAYHQEQTPTWCAWQVAAERARRDGAPCLLVSPCPTLELLRAGRLVTPSRQAERAGWPAVDVVDRSRDDPRTGLFSDRLVDLVRGAGSQPGRRIVCVVNRTGRVRLLCCAACGELARCERCHGPLEQVRPATASTDVGPRRSQERPATPGAASPSDQLRCRRCGLERPVVCARCGATRLRVLRRGVSRLREEIEALAGVPVAEVATGSEPPLTPAHDPMQAPVVVGTEAVLHRLGSADAVCFLDFDAELLAPRLRAGEEAMALLARAARLVAGAAPPSSGRAGGRILVQTRLPRHEVLQAAVLADPSRLAAAEADLRRALELPPETAVATVSGAAAPAFCDALAVELSGGPWRDRGVQLSGPLDGTWTLRARHHADLCDLLAAVERPGGRLRIEVDPVRM